MDCSTLHLCSADSPGPFLFTPNSLLLENTLITDLQQITGNEQQSITCSDERGDILREGSTTPLDTKGSISPPKLQINGQYHCWSSPNKRIFFNVFTKNLSKCEFICRTGAKMHEYCVSVINSLRTHDLEFTYISTPFHSCPAYTYYKHQCWRVDLHIITKWKEEIYCRG